MSSEPENITKLKKTEYFKEYRTKKKDELLKKAKEKVKCQDCGELYTKSNKTKHLQSKMHKKIIDVRNQKITSEDITKLITELIEKKKSAGTGNN